MKYHIKQEPGTCEFSGKEANVLISIESADGTQFGWICREALQDAANLLSILESGLQKSGKLYRSVEPVAGIMVRDLRDEAEESAGEEEAPVIPKKSGSLSRAQLQQLKAFESDCSELIDNPPPDSKGRQSGVPEWAIRELVEKWKYRVENPKILSPILQKLFGMPRERIDFLLN